MSRKSRTNQYKQEFSQRLSLLMRVHLKLSAKELAALMGHASTSTMRNALEGTGGLDIERLSRLGQLKTEAGAVPNLDWLLTGRGAPLLPESLSGNDAWQVWLSTERKQALKLLAAVPLPQDL